MSNTEQKKIEYLEYHNNSQNLQTLIRGLRLSLKSYSFFLIKCNYILLQNEISQEIKNKFKNTEQIVLDKNINNLYQPIETENSNSPLIILGFDLVNTVDEIINSMQRDRDKFARYFSFPVVLFVNRINFSKIVRKAPDFFNTISVPMEFQVAPKILVDLIQTNAKFVCTETLKFGSGILNNLPNFQDAHLLNYSELELAKLDLQSLKINLSLEQEASLEFLLGNALCASIKERQHHYQTSLDLFRRISNIEYQACVMYYLGLSWFKLAVDTPLQKNHAYNEALKCYQECITIFTENNLPKLKQKFINAPIEVLKRLKQWQNLKHLIYEALKLHHECKDIFRLGRIYGFCAELAIFESRWEDAKKDSQKAINYFNQAWNHPNISVSREWLKWYRSCRYGWYLLSLAQSQNKLGEIDIAISNLKLAKEETNPEYDPELYLGIINELKEIYFDKKEYLKAFLCQQEFRSLEQAFGFRSFTGAVPLQAKIQVTNPTLLPTELERNNLLTSIRKNQVKDLIERLNLTEHKLTILYGASGVGKSSFLKAMLIPSLENSKMNPAIRLGESLIIFHDDYSGNWEQKIIESFQDTLQKYNINYYERINSIDNILEELRKRDIENQQIVLILDNLEDFFWMYKKKEQRKFLAIFLCQCLNIFKVKIILSIKEEYLYCLLGLKELADFGIISGNILDKNNIICLNNFSIDDAKEDIKNLTARTHTLDNNLIDQIIVDLAENNDEVKPIELQLIETQIETERIFTLDQYQKLGRNPKDVLIQKYLDEIIYACGEETENRQLARLIFYLLTDKSNTRPHKTKEDFLNKANLLGLSCDNKLEDILDILTSSQMVNKNYGEPIYYQLAHDHLIEPIRQIFQYNERELMELMILLESNPDELVEQLIVKEIQTSISEAQIYLLQHKKLRSLKTIIKASKKVENIKQIHIKNTLKSSIESTLKEAFYSLDERNSLDEHKSDIYSIDFSPDSKLLISGSADCTIKIWYIDQHNLINSKLITTLEKTHDDCITSVKFSSEAHIFASSSADRKIKLWKIFYNNCDLDSFRVEEINNIEGHRDWVWDICFSCSDIKMIASASGDCTIKLCKLDDNFNLFCILNENVLWEHQDKIYSIDFGTIKNRKLLTSCSEDGQIKVWDISTKTCIRTISDRRVRKPIRNVKFSPDGNLLAAAAENGLIMIWDVNQVISNENSKPKITLDAHQGCVNSVCFSSDGTMIAAGSDNNKVRIWSIEGDLLKTFRGHSDSIRAVRFSHDNKVLASAGDDNQIKLWQVNLILPTTLRGHDNKVHSICFSRNNETLISAGWDRTVKIWQFENDQWKYAKSIPASDWLWDVSISPDGHTIAYGGGDCVITLWDIHSGRSKQMKGHQECIHSICFSSNGRYLASASGDNTAILWDAINAQQITKLTGHTNKVWSISFSPNSDYLVTSSDDNTISLWDINGFKINSFTRHHERVNSVIFGSDGKYLISASNDGTLKKWSIDNKQLLNFKGHNGKVYDVSLHPNGDLIASAGTDQTIRIWSINGTLLKTLEGHQGAINSVTFSYDGRYIASASNDQTIKIWDLYQIDELRDFSFEELVEKSEKLVCN